MQAEFHIVALASDDPGIFSNIGLSFDFFQVGQDNYLLIVSLPPSGTRE
jgi:hypothetical protein